MKISLIIDTKVSQQIENIKTRLYGEGFRADNKLEPGSPPHIKLAEAKNPQENEKVQIESELNKVLDKYKNFSIKNFQVVNEKQSETSNWISLSCNELWLKNLGLEIENVLNKYKINETLEYKSKIYEIRKSRDPLVKIELKDCIADHLNLLNKCKTELAQKAFEKFRFLNDLDEIKPHSLYFEY